MKKIVIAVMAGVLAFAMAGCACSAQSSASASKSSSASASATSASASSKSASASAASASASAASAASTTASSAAASTAAASSAAASQGAAQQVQGGSQDGQNPAMNFVGSYSSDRASAEVSAAGDTGAAVTITGASSATETSTWTMSDTIDTASGVMNYSGCTKTTTKTEEGSEPTETVDYTDGTGTITFSTSGQPSFSWQDDKEGAGDGMTFTFSA